MPLVFQRNLSHYGDGWCLFASLPCYGVGLMFVVVYFFID
jgi:hypothetical protein